MYLYDGIGIQTGSQLFNERGQITKLYVEILHSTYEFQYVTGAELRAESHVSSVAVSKQCLMSLGNEERERNVANLLSYHGLIYAEKWIEDHIPFFLHTAKTRIGLDN